jgi:hypothetical protein
VERASDRNPLAENSSLKGLNRLNQDRPPPSEKQGLNRLKGLKSAHKRLKSLKREFGLWSNSERRDAERRDPDHGHEAAAGRQRSHIPNQTRHDRSPGSMLVLEMF